MLLWSRKERPDTAEMLAQTPIENGKAKATNPLTASTD
jgi:hypothetical protein